MTSASEQVTLCEQVNPFSSENLVVQTEIQSLQFCSNKKRNNNNNNKEQIRLPLQLAHSCEHYRGLVPVASPLTQPYTCICDLQQLPLKLQSWTKLIETNAISACISQFP